MQAPGMQFVYITLCKIRGLHRINSISNRVCSENNGLHQKTNSGDGNGDPLQHSCLENPWTGEPAAGYSPIMGSQRDTTNWLHFHLKNKQTDEQIPTSRIVVLKLLANSPHDEISIAKQIKVMDRYLG